MNWLKSILSFLNKIKVGIVAFFAYYKGRKDQQTIQDLMQAEVNAKDAKEWGEAHEKVLKRWERIRLDALARELRTETKDKPNTNLQD